MLYQLSYASPVKPSEIITGAIKLQARFSGPANLVPARQLSSCYESWDALLYSRLGKFAILKLDVMAHLADSDRE